MNTFFNKKGFLNICVLYFDLILFGLFIYTIYNDLLYIISYVIDTYNNLFSLDNNIFNMTPNPNTPSGTNTTIHHSNDGWAQGIKSIFIYGSGALRLSLLRTGSPAQRGFVIASTVAADAASTALKNAINDPEYVEKHINSWKRIINGDSLELHVDGDNETYAKVSEIKNNFLPENFDVDSILTFLIDHLKSIIEPVTVNYSNEILANQIYGISIILFILSILILILLFSFLFNIFLLVYSDKLMNFFTNKYIRWYVAFNKKIIGIEICFLGGSLLYFMYVLSYGIHFIATHPILFN